MNFVISDHLQRKNYLLLKPQLPFNDGFKNLGWKDELYYNLKFDEYMSINLRFKRQFITFNTLSEDKKSLLIAISEDENNCRFFGYNDSIISFNFMCDDMIISYFISNKKIYFKYLNRDFNNIYNFELSRTGKLIGISISEELSLSILDTDITPSLIKKFKELYHKLMKTKRDILANLVLEIHPNKSIKKFGITLDNKKDGFYYELDESGGLEISSYLNDELHGYYFNSKTEEQGFYENGNRVGFWKEYDQIIKYGRDRTFFIFPVFFF